MQGIKTRATATAATASQQQASSTTAATPGSAAEASKMLEAALQQMDGIISGAAVVGGVTTANNGVAVGHGGSTNDQSSVTGSLNRSSGASTAMATLALSERSLISASNVLSTAKTLALALQQVGLAAPAPDAVTAAIISDWLETHIPRQDADERLRRLQRDKESLAMQYQSLLQRVTEQADKIIDLEGLLTEKTQQLGAKEELLQRQMLSRSTLETQKLELMTALSELKLHRAALERENVELRGVEVQIDNGNDMYVKRLVAFGSMGNLQHINHGSAGVAPKTPPASLRHQIHPQFHSLPRSHASKSTHNNNNNHSRSFDANANASKQRNVAFASNEKILIDDHNAGVGSSINNELMYGSFISNQTTNSSPSPNLRERSAKGLRNIFGKLRRSNSGNLELPALEQVEPEFKRGGARATAGGRIEWSTQSSQISATASAKSYVDWSVQEVCNWLCDLGLSCYEEECRKWLKANPSVCFFTAAPIDIEKELGIKATLHRKKIQLAIDELTGKETDELALKAAQLDVSWVMRWLDDIGLPQYKDTFMLAKMDGRMLHRLTMEDLSQLHVTSCLHIASLRRAIQCMREMHWHPECLIRRSTKPPKYTKIRTDSGSAEDGDAGADDSTTTTEADDNSEQVHDEYIGLWTAHRVMEWLRVADLSEYAPNLRGAGVHGALMLYEQRFNANLLADLLSIPPSKTLLRRHLATHFKELLGRDVIQTKRDAEAAANYQPLTITAKIKAPKKTQFSLKRRKSNKGAAAEIEWTDYVCPMVSACLGSEQQQRQQPMHNSSTTSSTSTNNSSSN